MYKYLLIDCDDTILDFGKSERVSIAKVMENHGVKATKEDIEEYVRINENLWHMFEKGEISKEALLEKRFEDFFSKFKVFVNGKDVNIEYLDTLTENAFLIDGILDVLTYLKDKGYKLYIITNGVKRTQLKRWDQTGILKWFDGYFISEDMGYHKPQKEYFDIVLKTIGDDDLSKYLVIGDSIASDIKGGINAKIDVAWYNPHLKKTDVKLNYEFHNLKDYYLYL